MSDRYVLYDLVKPEWFGNAPDGVNFFVAIAQCCHIWDDLIDKDKPVSDEKINDMMRVALVFLPLNSVYQKISHAAPHFWASIISAYETANKYEKDKDEKGLEIGHNLRYAVGHLIAYAMEVCIGTQEARKHLPDMWKLIVFENFEDYKKEHLNA
jgi:hypothetical protein